MERAAELKANAKADAQLRAMSVRQRRRSNASEKFMTGKQKADMQVVMAAKVKLRARLRAQLEGGWAYVEPLSPLKQREVKQKRHDLQVRKAKGKGLTTGDIEYALEAEAVHKADYSPVQFEQDPSELEQEQEKEKKQREGEKHQHHSVSAKPSEAIRRIAAASKSYAASRPFVRIKHFLFAKHKSTFRRAPHWSCYPDTLEGASLARVAALNEKRQVLKPVAVRI